MSGEVTREHVAAGRLREDGHLNYGRDGFGYSHQHTTIPRLSCIDRFYKGPALRKSGTASARLWCVDGVQAGNGSLDDALERLKQPVEFTEDEGRFLALVPDEWTDLRALCREHADAFPKGPDGQSPLVLSIMLRRKGAVEVQRREAEKASFIRRARDGSSEEARHGR